LLKAILCFLAAAVLTLTSMAQDHGHNMDMSEQTEPRPATAMDMSHPVSGILPSFHAGSGTGWQPASVPAHLWMTSRAGWDLMAHGTFFLTYNQQGGPRGEGKAESVNYLMLMEQHRLGSGTILFREMLSAESLTSPHPGFPLLFQTGETYHGQALVNHQHPHNVFAELSMLYTVPVSEKVSWLFYGGPSAEPALGPVTYIHRESASENPAAPLSHHLQDSTHTSFGVVTTGFIVDRFKIEASAFNGREPDEDRWDIQLAPLDSWSFRISAAPTRNWAGQYSYGRLEHPEALEPGSELRQTASLEYNRLLAEGNWATSVIWGRKRKLVNDSVQNSYVLESTVNFRRLNYGYTRLELVDKDELFPQALTHPSFRIGEYTFGGVRDLLHNQHWQLGLGADVTFYSKPAVLDPIYGNSPVSFHVFLRVRPGLSGHGH
jgi:hypothetical protein